MEKAPQRIERQEDKEAIKNSNSIFEWGVMPKNTDVLTKSENVYRQVRSEALDDLRVSGVVRNAGSAGVGRVRKYGDRVYWTRGKDGEFHNVQPDHVVLEAPFAIANSRVVTVDDLIGIHARNESGEIENRVATILQEQGKQIENSQIVEEESEKLADVRRRLGLAPKE